MNNNSVLGTFLGAPNDSEKTNKNNLCHTMTFKVSTELAERMEQYTQKKIAELGRKNYSSSHLIREAIELLLIDDNISILEEKKKSLRK